MITKNQRCALFALREALHLCELAEVTVNACSDSYVQVCLWNRGNIIALHCSETEDLLAADVETLLNRYPES